MAKLSNRSYGTVVNVEFQVECGKGQKIRQRKRNCIGGVMGEAPGCPYKGNVQLEYGACDVQCGKYTDKLLVSCVVPSVVSNVVSCLVY